MSTEALSGTDPFTGAIMAVVRMAILAGLPYTDLRDSFSHIRPCRKVSALFSRLCRRGSPNSGAPERHPVEARIGIWRQPVAERHAVDADHIASIDNVIKDYDKIEVHCH
jgi:hypothetical protein